MHNFYRILKDNIMFRYLLIGGICILILSNFLITQYHDGKRREAEESFSKEVYLRESLLDERIAVVNQDLALQRQWIIEMISQQESNIHNGRDVLDYFEFHNEKGYSTLKQGNYNDKGNIVYYGDYKSVSDEDYREMNAILEVFDLMKVVLEVNEKNFWTTYFDMRYIAMYPWDEIDESLGDVEILFAGVQESIELLNEDLTEELIDEGWENGVFLDASGEVLMVQKCLPIMIDQELRGIVCSNTEIDYVSNWIDDEEIVGRFMIIDSDNNMVYDSTKPIIDIHSITEEYDENFLEDISSGTGKQQVLTQDNKVYFLTQLDQINWRIIHEVPNSYIEEVSVRMTTYIIVNGLVILVILLILLVGIRRIKDDQKLARQKDEFVMMVSHDLKAPLSSIMGFNELIEEKFNERIVPLLAQSTHDSSKDVARIQRNLKIIHQESERLTHFIKNILDLAKLNSGSLNMEKNCVNLVELVNEIVEKLKVESDKKGIEISCISNHKTLVWYGDKYYLTQLIYNFMDNGIKYTMDGYVTLELVEYKEFIEVIVRDTGIGMNPEQVEKAKKPFVRIKHNSKNAESIEGNGLGLTICHRIVEEINGRMKIESQVGEGTTVKIHLFKEVADECCDN